MKVFNTDMEFITLVFLISELILFLYQILFFYQSSFDKKKGYYLRLLLLFIIYNLFGGLFPDPNLTLNIELQNILAWGSGFAVACYLPYYFYKAFQLKSIKFHVFYGVGIFLVLPFLAFLVVEYTLTKNLERSIEHVLIVPSIYAIVVMFIIYNSIRKKFKVDSPNNSEILLTYISVLPWVSMPLLSYFKVSQIVEVSVMNGGFVIISFLFFLREIREGKEAHKKVSSLMNDVKTKEELFFEKCEQNNLTAREIEVVKLILIGLKYKEIAGTLFISERTVTKHSQNMFLKLGVSNKFDLIKALNS